MSAGSPKLREPACLEALGMLLSLPTLDHVSIFVTYNNVPDCFAAGAFEEMPPIVSIELIRQSSSVFCELRIVSAAYVASTNTAEHRVEMKDSSFGPNAGRAVAVCFHSNHLLYSVMLDLPASNYHIFIPDAIFL